MKFLKFTFLLILFLLPGFSFATTDPDTAKYALNDPRNPDCPCHAAQKLADEEYKKLQEQNQQVVVNTTDANTNTNPTDVNTNANKVVTTSSGNGSSKHYSSSRHFLKQLKKFNRKMKKQLRKKGNGTKKGNRRLASCFHF